MTIDEARRDAETLMKLEQAAQDAEILRKVVRARFYHPNRLPVPMVFDADTAIDALLIIDKRVYRLTTMNETDDTVEVRIERKEKTSR